mgnify:CR=1 FL=1
MNGKVDEAFEALGIVPHEVSFSGIFEVLNSDAVFEDIMGKEVWV